MHKFWTIIFWNHFVKIFFSLNVISSPPPLLLLPVSIVWVFDFNCAIPGSRCGLSLSLWIFFCIFYPFKKKYFASCFLVPFKKNLLQPCVAHVLHFEPFALHSFPNDFTINTIMSMSIVNILMILKLKLKFHLKYEISAKKKKFELKFQGNSKIN